MGDSQPSRLNDIINSLTDDLEYIRHNVLDQMGQDIQRLQSQKTELVEEIDQLQNRLKGLRSQESTIILKQHLAQQEQLLHELAQILAAEITEVLLNKLTELSTSTSISINSPIGPTLPTKIISEADNEQLTKLINSLEKTISETFKSLQSDLNTYQYSLSQQLGRMQTLENRGEAIIESLVSRLTQEIEPSDQSELPPTPISDDIPTIPPPTPPKIQPPVIKRPPPQVKSAISFQSGITFIIISTLSLALHNIGISIIGQSTQIFGLFPIGGYIKLGLASTLLILWLRMVVILPMIIFFGTKLYPHIWKDLHRFLFNHHIGPLFTVILSGFFFFISQIFLYIAIGMVGPSIGVTLIYLYPIITLPLTQLLYHERLSFLRLMIIGSIISGIALSATQASNTTGIITGILAGITFALYLILMQIGFRKLHPVPVSFIQFSTLFILSSIGLILPMQLESQLTTDHPTGLLLGGLALGILMTLGYFSNHFGVRSIGAPIASLISSINPFLTAILGFIIIPGPSSQPTLLQIFGILIVTISISLLSLEKINQRSKTKTN